MISFIFDIRRKQTFSNAYLAVFDWYLGVHLVIIALTDFHYKENYVGLEMSWRNSLPCKLAAFFALVSMTVSPTILSIIM